MSEAMVFVQNDMLFNTHVFVAFVHVSQPVGIVIADYPQVSQPMPPRPWPSIEILYLHVIPEYRGNGVGKFMIQELQGDFDRILVKRLPDEEMSAVYGKLGFVKLESGEMEWKRA